MTSSIAAATAERAEREAIPLPSGPSSPACPKCNGRMWDNRASKRNPRAPDFKCRNRSCDGVLWPGDNRRPFPAIAPLQLAAIRADSEPSNDCEDATVTIVSNLRRKYLELTDFALDSVRPKYEQRGLECGSDTVAAIVATLYIAETRRDGL
jgi:hypothetical protein